MAMIYGRAESEKELLNLYPKSVKKFDDIETVHQELKDQLTEKKNQFFKKVPSQIKEEEKKLEQIKKDEKITIQNFDDKIKNLEEEKAKGGFSSISAPIKISILKKISKPRKIKKIKGLEKKQQEQLSEWKENPEGIFKNIQKETISEIKNFDENKKSAFHPGARGEIEVLEKLSHLSDDHHVLCGLNIGLSNYVRYNGKKNWFFFSVNWSFNSWW